MSWLLDFQEQAKRTLSMAVQSVDRVLDIPDTHKPGTCPPPPSALSYFLLTSKVLLLPLRSRATSLLYPPAQSLQPPHPTPPHCARARPQQLPAPSR
jgi:hypothetical protein